MPGYFVRAVIIAELRRARRAGRQIDRRYLRSETGIGGDALEWRISDASLELDEKESAAAYSPQQGGGGGAKPGPGPSPKEPDPDPFAPPQGGKASERQSP